MVQSAHKQLIDIRLHYWVEHSLFTYHWWLLVILSVLGWTIWWKTVDKRRLPEIALFGALILIVTTLLDGFGNEFLVWDYRIQVTPTFGRFLPVDFAALPLTNMWLYQYFRTWKSFFIAVFVMSAVFSFILEPFVIWLGIYDPMQWKHIYSFPIYIALSMGIRFVVQRMYLVQERL